MSFDTAQSSEAVEDLKRQGNEVLKSGNIQGAIDKYSQGLRFRNFAQSEPWSVVLI